MSKLIHLTWLEEHMLNQKYAVMILKIRRMQMSSNLITIALYIDNMTCVNCENVIERTLSETAGITNVKASYSKGTVALTYDNAIINEKRIAEILEKENYYVKNQNFDQKKYLAKESSNSDTAYNVADSKQNHHGKAPAPAQGQNSSNLIGIVIILFAIYLVAKRFGLINIFNEFPVAKEGMGYGMLFLIGLLTSVHCVAMCGGICLSQCVPQKEGSITSRFIAVRPSLLYNLGRVISYTVIGGIVGAIGSVVSFSGAMKGLVQILAGVFMVIMGLNMLNIFPWLRKFNPRMPKIFAKKIYAKRQSNSPLFIGILNGLMPCGPLQAMQLYALSTGSPFKGAFAMFLFSIGTVPLMFAFGALSSFLSKKFTAKMMSVSAVLVIFLGIFMFNNGMGLSGFVLPSFPSSASSAQKAKIATLEGDVQLVTSGITSGSYEPIIVQKGIPVKWTIQAENGEINGCNNSINVPKYNLQKRLTVGDNVIEFTPTESETVSFSCWMGMIRSKITVVDDLNRIEASTMADAGATTASSGSCCSGGASAYGNSDSGNVNSGSKAEGDNSNGLKDFNNLMDITIPTEQVAVAKVKEGKQTVEISYNSNGFTPAVIIVQKGMEAKWSIKATEVDANRNSIIFPYYYAQLEVLDGENPINFIPDQDFDFFTSDSAYYGYVKVVDDLEEIDIDAIKQEISQYRPSDYSNSGGLAGPSCH